MKVWDIVQPKDVWERGYARLEYERTGLLATFSKRIHVHYYTLAAMADGPDDYHWELSCDCGDYHD